MVTIRRVKLIVVTISQCIHVLNYHVVYLKKSHFTTYLQFLFFNKAMRTNSKTQEQRKMRINYSQRKFSVYFRSKIMETGQVKEKMYFSKIINYELIMQKL